MAFEEWRNSIKRAWHDPFIRWTSILELVAILAGSAFFLWRLIPEGLRSGVLILHYNIYLGIDDVRAWPWIFFVPGAMLVVYLADLVAACVLLKTDELAARALVALTAVLTVAWAVAAFFLILVNL